MTTTTVRAATPEDARAVLDLHVRSRTIYYRGFVPDAELAEENRRAPADYARMIRDRVVRCAERDGQLVGFVVVDAPYHEDPDPAITGELYQIHVEPAVHGQGVGTALHRTAVEVWRRQNVRAARLWVWEFNERARAFYHRNGWRPDGHHPPGDPRIGDYRMRGYRLDVA